MENFWVKLAGLQKKIEPMLTFLMRGEMEQHGVQLDREAFCCSICLDLLKDPVAIPCGHSYCMKCVQNFWDEEDQKGIHSCPQCRKSFIPRPALEKNIMLAFVMEQLKKTGLQAAPAGLCYAGPEDVACDVCSGRKLKAIKSCLVCRASYCEKHLQPHYDAAALQKHQLVDPSKKLQENICSRHDELMKMFCRTDQEFICYLCSVDEHKGHNVVLVAEERAERQRELQLRRDKIQQRIQDREKDVKLLQQELEAINHSADKTLEDSEEIFTQLIRLLHKRSSDVKQQIRSQQETEVSRVKELEEKLEQEMTELKRKDAELKQLSHTEDHYEFILKFSAPTCLSNSVCILAIHSFYLQHFDEVRKVVSGMRDKVQQILREEHMKVSPKASEVEAFLPQPEPKRRSGFLKYSCEITLDPNTANPYLLLSKKNKEVMFMLPECYPCHPDRCAARGQILSRESLTGRCYWEVEKGLGGVSVVVAYKDNDTIKEKFGENNKSWALSVFKRHVNFTHQNITTRVSNSGSSRVGVYLDHRAGVLSFYRVSETMTLLHRVQTTFTQPLHAGITLHDPIGNSARIIKDK